MDSSKLKAFADENLYLPKRTISVCDRVEKIGENAGYQC